MTTRLSHFLQGHAPRPNARPPRTAPSAPKRREKAPRLAAEFQELLRALQIEERGDAERRQKVAQLHLALGRIFGLMSRPYQEGDDRVFAECRAIVLQLHEELGGPAFVPAEPPALQLLRHRVRFGDSG